MFKYNIGDKVIYDNKECTVTGQLYFKEHINKKVVINENKDYIVEDKKGNKYSCKEGDLRKMKRIDEILNSEDPYDTLATMLERSCGTHCIFSKNCEGKDCKEGIKEYLNKEIDKPKVKSDDEPIGIRKREEELKIPEEHLKDAIKEVNKENNNEFMKTYEDIVNQMKDTCIKKNHDYGSSVLSTFDEFGRISYLTRISDKWNRIKTLCSKDEQLVNDESILDSALDMANYLLLWIANETMNK